MKKNKILVIGACGQIGTELIPALRHLKGSENVIAADIYHSVIGLDNYVKLDALDEKTLRKVIREKEISQVYLLAAMLSAKGEQQIDLAWNLNVHSLLSVLRIAQEEDFEKIFWPSSIAVFGPGSPKYNCHQFARMEPKTVYGISKRAGEYWCNYYAEKFNVDVRSIRYPGLISWKAKPGGGTTDYAIDIFHAALEGRDYTCYLSEDNCLPMMYMDDAVRATIELTEAPKEKVGTRLSYNLSALSFAPCDLAAEIRRYIPDFKISYQPDFRNEIANTWPASISDHQARTEWGWAHQFDIQKLVREMLSHLIKEKNIKMPEPKTNLTSYSDFPQEDHELSVYQRL